MLAASAKPELDPYLLRGKLFSDMPVSDIGERSEDGRVPPAHKWSPVMWDLSPRSLELQAATTWLGGH